jgi:formylmethanofuran dehydrogenase subunit D
MPSKRLILNPMRTAKQGVNVNIGKDGDEYKEIVTTLSIHPNDMQALGVADGDSVRVRTEFGEAEFKCMSAKVPEGLAFVPYGPPTCRLMGGDTDGTGMPTSKGWEVDVEPIAESTSNESG